MSACCSSRSFLGRRVYAVFGVIGIAIYLGDLANKVFKDSLLFPFALSLIGVAVIAAGLLYHRNERAIAAWLSAHLPAALLRFRSFGLNDESGIERKGGVGNYAAFRIGCALPYISVRHSHSTGP